MADNPITAIAAVEAMRQDWAVIAPLMGGTRAMRAAGQVLLPKFPAEDEVAFQNRLSLSTLLPAYSETVGNMTDRVFAEPIQVGDDVPDALKLLSTDVDLAGNDLNSWAVNWFRTGLAMGLVHAWVEVPRAEGVRTIADERQAGIRPYLVMVNPDQIIGWRSQGGRLTKVWYLEQVEEEVEEFGVEVIEQVRVLIPGGWQLYRKDGKSSQWKLHEAGENSLDEIPWVTFYTGRTGLMTARPPLIELAYLNIKHWQSQSDQDNILHIARVPMLAVMGVTDDSWSLNVGTSVATKLPENGDMKWVEHTGKSIDAGRQSLQDLLEEMRLAGARLLARDKQTNKTATQAEEDSAQENSPLARMAGQFADSLAQLLQFMADYINAGDGGHVEIRGNFDQDFAPEVSLPQLVAMADKGKLSDETLFTEFQRRGVISDEYDWQEEVEKLKAQYFRPDAAILAQLAQGVTSGTVSKEAYWLYVTTGHLPARPWSIEALHVENPGGVGDGE